MGIDWKLATSIAAGLVIGGLVMGIAAGLLGGR
jgi:hypothetical protein